MRTIFLVVVVLVVDALCAQPSFVPWPRNVQQAEGYFTLKQVRVMEGVHAEGWGTGMRAELSALGASTTSQDELRRSIRFQVDTTQGDEGYAITIARDRVDVYAATRQGALHATQTLRQLLTRDGQGAMHWPCVRIQDSPAYAWRGTMLDVCRHFYTVDFLKRYLDELARLKLNIFHWHLTDDQGWRVEVKKYPKLTEVGAWRTESDGTRYGGFYTQDEVKDIVQYAAARGITVVPEIEFPGHCSAAIAAYPWLGCTQDSIAVPTTWGVFNDVYCVGRDSTWTFFRDVLNEVVPLFPAPWFHIGGDEVPKEHWHQCTQCQQRMQHEKLKDEHELQAWTVKRLQQWLDEKGKRLIGWDEVLEGGLDSTAIVEVWRGDEEARKARANGNEMIRTIYFDASAASLTLDKVKTFDPLLDGDARGILGAECPLWSETRDPRNVGYNVFPRMQVFAERMWNGKVGDDIDQRIAPHIALLEREGWITATADKDLFRYWVEFDAEKHNWNITTECGRSDMEVAWTNGSAQGRMNDRLRIDAPCTVKLTPTWKGNALQDPAVVTITDHLALGAKQLVSPPPARKYGRDPLHGMTDGLLGSDSYSDGLWQGWWGEDATITIDLDSSRAINEVSIRCLQQVGAWIVLPRAVEFMISDDGRTWQAYSTATHLEPVEGSSTLVHRFATHPQTGVRARYVRAVLRNSGKLPAWHLGAGGESWVFADEMIVR